MSNVPDAWEDEWATVADAPEAPQLLDSETKKVSSKVTKAQKRAQQAEFNRQIWAEAEGPKQPNYFLESRNVVPLRQEFKPPPTLLSRKGPITQIQRPPPSITTISNPATATSTTPPKLANLKLNDESSEDEDEEAAKKLELEERKAKASRDREEKQRKYEERRLELFGPQYNNSGAQPPSTATHAVPLVNRSRNSSPGASTPPLSRSSTPNQRGGGRRGRGRNGGAGAQQHSGGGTGQPQPRILQQREVYDPVYSPKPDSNCIQKQTAGSNTAANNTSRADGVTTTQPVRSPRGPDGSGRGGFGFASRGAHAQGADPRNTVGLVETDIVRPV